MKSGLESLVLQFEDKYGLIVRDNHDLINYLSKKLFNSYEPSLVGSPTFIRRLLNWLNNIQPLEDKYTLFNFITEIIYVSQEELESLYVEAFNSIYRTWIIEQLNLSLELIELNSVLDQVTRDTWFCPITDSFKINSFYHINNIPSRLDYRPDWNSLSKFSNIDLVNSYIVSLRPTTS